MAEAQDTLYTCLSCTIAYTSPEEQREHYRSDYHRYNLKRRMVELPPVTLAVFNEKLKDRVNDAAVVEPKTTSCRLCSKAYTTENAYLSHMNSKKHKDKAALANKATGELDATSQINATPVSTSKDAHLTRTKSSGDFPPAPTLDDDATEEQMKEVLDKHVADVRSRLSPNDCLFCTTSSPSLEENLDHMSQSHSFFVPDAEYLVDLTGLIKYLHEKIVVGNICLYCNGRGREFRTLHAVRKHMIDKSHCKIAYDSQRDQLDISDYYDFTSSYPEAKKKAEETQDEEWEDVSDGDEDLEGDEIISEDASSAPSSDTEDDVPESQLTYGDSHLELVLPSGFRIGHRSMKRYYAQSYRLSNGPHSEDPKSGKALVRRLLADKNSALVPRKGGFGAFGAGTEVVKARNRGEAREAGRHIREFRDQKRREDFKTKVGYIHNNQKHFRDPNMP